MGATPHIDEVLEIMGNDNGYSADVYRDAVHAHYPHVDWGVLEALAARLDGEEKLTIVAGEQGEIRALADRRGVGHLCDFLDMIFDDEEFVV